jgi:feruloyl-CoA hydratase/lyase
MDFRQALYYSMTGEQFGGKRSVEIGFTTMSVPLAQLTEKTMQVANNIKGKDSHALKACKDCFKGVDIRNASYEDARYWLKARLGQMTQEQKAANWMDHGIKKFLGKEYQPGMGAVPKVEG